MAIYRKISRQKVMMLELRQLLEGKLPPTQNF